MLKELLKENIVEITFKKVDGNTRTLLATLQEDYLPKKESVRCRNINPDITSVWSVEDKGWRSFRNDSIISYTKKGS